MNNFTAIKPVYNRSTKTFEVTVIRGANVLLAHEGFLVYDDPNTALKAFDEMRLCQSWTPAKRVAVRAALVTHARGEL